MRTVCLLVEQVGLHYFFLKGGLELSFLITQTLNRLRSLIKFKLSLFKQKLGLSKLCLGFSIVCLWSDSLSCQSFNQLVKLCIFVKDAFVFELLLSKVCLGLFLINSEPSLSFFCVQILYRRQRTFVRSSKCFSLTVSDGINGSIAVSVYSSPSYWPLHFVYFAFFVLWWLIRLLWFRL
jgi:hypothetical protein